jgi:hypothetical protein
MRSPLQKIGKKSTLEGCWSYGGRPNEARRELSINGGSYCRDIQKTRLNQEACVCCSYCYERDNFDLEIARENPMMEVPTRKGMQLYNFRGALDFSFLYLGKSSFFMNY